SRYRNPFAGQPCDQAYGLHAHAASVAASGREMQAQSSYTSGKPALAALVMLDVAVAFCALRAAHAEIEFAHILVLDETLGRAVEDDLAGLHDVAVVRYRECDGGILLDQQHRHARLSIDACDDGEDFFDQKWRQAKGRLI